MSTALRRVIIIILGMLAGAAAWPLMELLVTNQESFPSYFFFSLVQGAVFGLVMGLFFGSAEGLTSKERGKILWGALLGAIIGIAGGIAGFLAGQGVLFLLVQRAFASYRTRQLIMIPLARVVGWAVLGIMIGLSEGVRARSLKKSLIGVLGGLVGGIIGGAAIEYLRILFPEFIYVRLIGLVLFGMLIGLFYSLLERGVSLGVLRILNGSRRGKEYSFAQNRISAGSGRRNNIVLPEYSGVADRHARFLVRGKDVYVRHEGAGRKLLVNERPVETEQLLKYEDVIQLGSAKLLYKTE
jgi:MFS family permease